MRKIPKERNLKIRSLPPDGQTDTRGLVIRSLNRNHPIPTTPPSGHLKTIGSVVHLRSRSGRGYERVEKVIAKEMPDAMRRQFEAEDDDK